MELLEIMKSRHSVRQYLEKTIEQEKRDILNEEAKQCNEKSGLHIQIIYDEPKCFNSLLAHYGRFSGCSNYIVIAGKDGQDIQAGYYGEKIVLKAQELGLNTCWVAMTKGKVQADLDAGEKVIIIVSLGYGKNQGFIHKNKPTTKIANVSDESPDWFKAGIEAVMLAPTAVNQQKFRFKLEGDQVFASTKMGPCAKIDLGIGIYHFEAISKHKVIIK